MDLVDASSILLRFEMEGINVGDRWNSLFPSIKPRIYGIVLTLLSSGSFLEEISSVEIELPVEIQEFLKYFLVTSNF